MTWTFTTLNTTRRDVTCLCCWCGAGGQTVSSAWPSGRRHGNSSELLPSTGRQSWKCLNRVMRRSLLQWGVDVNCSLSRSITPRSSDDWLRLVMTPVKTRASHSGSSITSSSRSASYHQHTHTYTSHAGPPLIVYVNLTRQIHINHSVRETDTSEEILCRCETSSIIHSVVD